MWGTGNFNTTGAMADFGLNLIRQGRYCEAEPLEKECLAICEKASPSTWHRFYAGTLLGGCLLGKGAYAKAEPLLVSGYEGLKAREDQFDYFPLDKARFMAEAGERIVRLYDGGAIRRKRPSGGRSSAPTLPKSRQMSLHNQGSRTVEVEVLVAGGHCGEVRGRGLGSVTTALAVLPTNRPRARSKLTDHASDPEP